MVERVIVIKFVSLSKTNDMIVERTNKEILVRLSPLTNTSDLQDMLDYLEYKELVSKSKAKQSDIDELAKQVNRSMMEKVRKSRR
jgi:hypothetical protein